MRLLSQRAELRQSHSPHACCRHLTAESEYLGLLRARDLTTFGFLRLDMRPAHAMQRARKAPGRSKPNSHSRTPGRSAAVPATTWRRCRERRKLGPAEVAAIQALPGENYLFDMELAELDVTFHYKFTPHWGGYLVLSGVNYSGGFLDSGIEGFHDAFGFDNNGRPAVSQNDVNLIADLKSADMAFLGAPTNGGLLDPTIGVRYSGIAADEGLEHRAGGGRQARVAGAAGFPLDRKIRLRRAGDAAALRRAPRLVRQRLRRLLRRQHQHHADRSADRADANRRLRAQAEPRRPT